MTDPDFRSKLNRYERTGNAVKHALTLNDFADLEVVFAARLSEPERIALAGKLLFASDPQNVSDLCQMVVGGAGQPGAPFEGVMDAAKHWAGYASPQERKCYLAACFDAMAAPERASALKWIEGRKNG